MTTITSILHFLQDPGTLIVYFTVASYALKAVADSLVALGKAVPTAVSAPLTFIGNMLHLFNGNTQPIAAKNDQSKS